VVEEHTMLPESYEVSDVVADELTCARRESRRVIAVGTTAVRTLETICDAHGVYQAGRGETSLFIYPGYRFKAVDALVTNFHLPDSTPLLLACAFYGHDAKDPFSLRFAYEAAKQDGYRFYSYGDAMFIQ
jgi:S-adenosylmethionine:tRNA ribosyltransferase-isomerase